MITTGWPAISLFATCGSEPSDCAPPLGGMQGTREKMSLADFATCFTVSIAFAVSVFGGDGSLVALFVDAGAWPVAAGDDGADCVCGEVCVCAACIGAVTFSAAWTVTWAPAGSTAIEASSAAASMPAVREQR